MKVVTDKGYTVWLVGMLKGGTRKTTTVFYLAWELARLGHDVLVIDADAGTQGVTEWGSQIWANHSEDDAVPFDIRQWAPGMAPLVQFVAQAQRDTGARFVLIDLGAEYPQILRQAAMVADQCIMPVGTDNAELMRLQPTLREVIEGGAKAVHVLLTRVATAHKGAAAQVREHLDSQGFHVLHTEIPRHLGMYADTFGTRIADTGAYADLVDEMADMGAHTR